MRCCSRNQTFSFLCPYHCVQLSKKVSAGLLAPQLNQRVKIIRQPPYKRQQPAPRAPCQFAPVTSLDAPLSTPVRSPIKLCCIRHAVSCRMFVVLCDYCVKERESGVWCIGRSPKLVLTLLSEPLRTQLYPMLGGQQTSLEIPVWAVPTPPHVTTWVYMALEGAKNLYSPLHSPSLAPRGEDSGVSSVVRADLSPIGFSTNHSSTSPRFWHPWGACRVLRAGLETSLREVHSNPHLWGI